MGQEGVGGHLYAQGAGPGIPLSITHNAFDAVNGLLVNSPGFFQDPSNIGDNPLFKEPLTGNYRLGSTSPCIDKGISHAGLPQWDIVGTARILNGSVEMGAYEFHVGAPEYFPVLQEAYNSSATGDEIEVWGIALSEYLFCGEDKEVTIRGGYNQPYESRPGETTLRRLTIGRGKVTVDGIVVR